MAVVGYMGSGKTTVGRLLARSLGRNFVDLDRAVAEEAGRSIPEIFEDGGEEAFRELEHRALFSALAEAPNAGSRVVACGGGVVLRPDNRELLRGAAAVFLKEDAGVLFRRTRRPGRPLRAASFEEFAGRYAGRLPLYEEVADLTVEVGGRGVGEVAEEVISWLSKG